MAVKLWWCKEGKRFMPNAPSDVMPDECATCYVREECIEYMARGNANDFIPYLVIPLTAIRKVECPDCGGTGERVWMDHGVEQRDPCPNCEGYKTLLTFPNK